MSEGSERSSLILRHTIPDLPRLLAQLVLEPLASPCARVERTEDDEGIAGTRDVARLVTAGVLFERRGKTRGIDY